MKNLLNLCLLIVIANYESFAVSKTVVATGDFSTDSIWSPSGAPTSSDNIILHPGFTLTVDGDYTVTQVDYYPSLTADAAASELIISSGNTLTVTGDFTVREPIENNTTALITVDGTLDVEGTFALDQSVNRDGMTHTIVVSGLLNIDGAFTHDGGSSSINDNFNFTISSGGSVTATTFSSTFRDQGCDVVLDIDGNFDATTVDFNLEDNTSTFLLTARDEADLDFTRFEALSEGSSSTITLNILADADVRSSGYFGLRTLASGGTSTVDVDCDGIFYARRFEFQNNGFQDVLDIKIYDDGDVRSNVSNLDIECLGDENDLTLSIDNGGVMRSGSNTLIDIRDDGVFDIDVNGTLAKYLTNGNLQMVFANSVVGTFDLASTGSISYSSISASHDEDCDVDITNNGSIETTNGNFSITARQNDDIDLVFNDDVTIVGDYVQSTTNNSSAVNTTIGGATLTCNSLRMDVNTTALSSANVITMTSSGSVLSVTGIDLDNTTKDGTITTATNGTTTTIFRGSTTVDLPIRTTVDYDNLTISNTSSGGVTLDEGDLDNSNFHGDLTVTSGATFDLNSTNSVYVQGDFSNAGTYHDNGQDLTVDGDFTNSFVFNNGGSDFTVGGNFINSGTFNTTSASTSLNVTGDFTNSGTFDAEFATLDVNGDFSNTAAYTAAGTGNDINVAGDWNNTGTYTFVSGDVVTFDGTTTQTVTGNTRFYDWTIDNSAGGTAVNISSGSDSLVRKLDIQDGLLTTGGNLVFLSTSSETAYITDLSAGTGDITGNVTVQRFLDEGNGWYLLGSPVTGSTLADWNAELPMSGFTGSDEPTNPWVSVYQYDESTRGPTGSIDSGYVAATNSTNSLTPGDGWFVYFQSVKAGKTANTVDVTGPLQKNSISTSTLTYTSIGSDSDPDRGYGLIANPYASPIDWTNMAGSQKVNLTSNEAYVLNSSGNYAAVTAGNIDYIYSGEAFWVKIDLFKSFPGLTGRVDFIEGDKVDVTDDYNARKATPAQYSFPLTLQLTYSGASGYTDFSVLRFAGDSNSVNHDGTIGEALKISNAYGTFPNISSFSVSDSNDVFYNNLNPSDSMMEFPIRIWTKYPSNTVETYTVDFNGIDDWVKNNKCLIMEDRLNNVTKKLDENDDSYSFTAMDTISSPYIYLSYSVPLEVESQNASCFGYNDGFASIEGKSSGKHQYLWFDGNNNIVKNEYISGPSVVNNLMPGEYVVYVSNNGVCGEVAATIEITEPDPIIADFDSDVDSVWMNANTTIFFSNGSINADDYHWDFGDGNTSDQENPAHTYTAGGTYTVKLVGITGPCSDTLTKTVVVFDNVGINSSLAQHRDPINIYQYNNETFVELDFNEATDATISMFDVLGRNIIEPMKLMNVTSRKERLDVPGNLMGVYTISVITADKKEAKKIYYTRR